MESYKQDLVRAGCEDTAAISYAYGRFRNGLAIPEVARAELWRQDATGDRWSDPFDDKGPDSYLRWLSETVFQDEREDSLPRIALLLWESRKDLQRTFPAPLADDYEEYVRWILSGEPAASGVDPDWFAELADGFKDRRIRLRPGNLAGSSDDESRSQEFGDTEQLDLQMLGADASFDSRQEPLIPKIAMLIWEDRHDIHEAFQAPLGQSRRAFARWYTTFARFEYRIPDPLVLPTLRTMPLRDRIFSAIWRWLADRGHIRVIPQGSWRQLASTNGSAVEES